MLLESRHHVVVQVDLDAILSRAEMREEEEEVPQSEANKELLAAFKCTTLTFEETEKDMEMEGRSYPTVRIICFMPTKISFFSEFFLLLPLL
jgi:hypothetical protein